MDALKDFVRPPFANYDMVVYFGGGLFSLPFIYRYFLHPFGVPLPSFVLNESPQITLEIIRALAMLVSVYILGHLIAYLSSQLVEKAVDRFLGKISTSIIISMRSTNASRDAELKKVFVQRVHKIRSDHALFSAVVRAIFHFPNFLHYTGMYLTGIFGYLDTRVPKEAFEIAKAKYAVDVIPNGQVAIATKWFKSLEYYVINNVPEAVPRMYNYLVMAGLFRSLSFIFLWASWFILFYLVCHLVFDTWPLGLTDSGTGFGAGIIEWWSLSTLSVFSLVAYLKFQRRYAEEAIMALAFAKQQVSPNQAP